MTMAVAQTPAEVSDEMLAEAAHAGDRTAFTTLVARYRGIAVAYAFARLHNGEEAEDIAQEAFVRAFQALPRFRVTDCWGAWLMRIVRNLCTDALRRRRGHTFALLEESLPMPGLTPEGSVLAEEEKTEIARAVANLPEKFRIPLLMHYASGRTYREIAVALDLPESTIIGRMAGAMRLLRRRFPQEVET